MMKEDLVGAAAALIFTGTAILLLGRVLGWW